MKPLRWFAIAIVAGCLGLMTQTASAATHPVASSHRTPTQLRQYGPAAPRPLPESRRAPTAPASRPKTRHSNTQSTRTRGHSSCGVLTYAPNVRPDDSFDAARSTTANDVGSRLNRMLESRGPPRAGPLWDYRVVAGLPPSPAHLSSSAHLAAQLAVPRSSTRSPARSSTGSPARTTPKQDGSPQCSAPRPALWSLGPGLPLCRPFTRARRRNVTCPQAEVSS